MKLVYRMYYENFRYAALVSKIHLGWSLFLECGIVLIILHSSTGVFLSSHRVSGPVPMLSGNPIYSWRSISKNEVHSAINLRELSPFFLSMSFIDGLLLENLHHMIWILDEIALMSYSSIDCAEKNMILTYWVEIHERNLISMSLDIPIIFGWAMLVKLITLHSKKAMMCKKESLRKNFPISPLS